MILAGRILVRVRVLLVEDDAELRSAVAVALRRVGLGVDEAGDLRSAHEQLFVTDYDVVVLDRMLPDGDAAELLSRIRAEGATVPVLFLSCRNDVADRVTGLEVGGDDYLGKPFATAELLARIRALGRRTATVQAAVLTLGDLVIDQARARASRAGRPLTLTPKEYSLLEYLVRNAGRVVAKQDLLEHCWDEFADPVSNVVEARIGRLRAKLGDPALVHTVRGTGYLAATRP